MFSLSLFAATGEHRPVCPIDVPIEALPYRDVSEHIRLAWVRNEVPPKVPGKQTGNGSVAALRAAALKAKELFDPDWSYQGHLTLVQFELPAGLAALYCPSYQGVEDRLVLFVSPRAFDVSAELERAIAHEAFHYWFDLHRKQAELWIEEGFAYLVEYLYTGQLSGGPVLEHLNHACDPLAGEPSTLKYRSLMGQAQLFFVYLHSRYGVHHLRQVLTDDHLGRYDLAPGKTRKSFEDLFVDFQVAKLVNRIDEYSVAADKEKYFLFSTTLVAGGSCEGPLPWSAQEFHEGGVKPAGFRFRDVLVKDQFGSQIEVLPQAVGSTITGARKLRVFFEATPSVVDR